MFSTQIIDSMKFRIRNREYSSKSIKLFFSRDKPNSDFYFSIYNKTKKIEIVVLNNMQLISVGSLNTDTKELEKIKTKVIK